MRASMVDFFDSYRSVHGPASRWRLASQVTRHELARLGADDMLLRAQRYCSRLAEDERGLLAANAEPAIAQAVALNNQNEKLGRLKLMSLAGLPLEEIVGRSGLDAEVITVWRALFFDLSGMEHAVDWLHAHVIAPEEHAGRGDVAVQLKMVRSGGPAAARLLLDAADAAPLDELGQLEQRRLKLKLLLERALSMVPTTGSEALKLIKLGMDYEFGVRRLELAERGFEELCRRRHIDHERAKARQQALKLCEQRKQEELELRRAERRRKDEIRQSQRERKHRSIRARVELVSHMQAAWAQATRAWAANSALRQLTWADAGEHSAPGSKFDTTTQAGGEEAMPTIELLLQGAYFRDGPAAHAVSGLLEPLE